MIPLRLAEIAEITRGTLTDPTAADTVVDGSVVVDSRRAGTGSLFVAVSGERADGHDFAPAAQAAGAVAALSARPLGVPAVVVDDVVAALGRLARGVVDRLPAATVVGVTGSSGKTSTKDLLGQLLGWMGPTIAPEGSYNNEIGLPLTVLRATETTHYLALELSARGLGHISHLCGAAPPTVGVVLNVGTAHVGEFGDQAAIARAKGELVEALPPEGIAVLNADDPRVAAMAKRTRARVATFGHGEDAVVRASDVTLDAQGRAQFTLVTPEGRAPVDLRLHGGHQVTNALAAGAAARACGMDVSDIARALGEAGRASKWRMEVTELPNGITVINDAYNANPESTDAALETLGTIGAGRRTWAVLGEMAELGETSSDAHDRIGRQAARLGVSLVVVVGEAAAPIAAGTSTESAWEGEALRMPDARAAVALLVERARPGDVVLVKGSLVTGLGPVADELATSVLPGVNGGVPA